VQPPTDGPRAAYTIAQVRYLIENTSSFDTSFGLQLLDGDLTVLADVSDYLVSASVSRDNYADIHASASFELNQPLSWGNSIVRPYFQMTGPTSSTATALTTMTFYLGAFFTDSPAEDLSEDPPTYSVTGYDILSILDDAIGDAYSVDTGVDALDQVELILQARGVTQYTIDRDRAGTLIVSPMVWTLDDNVTWLVVVNALLAFVGYQGVWADWNGVFRCQTYTDPGDRASEWSLTSDIDTTILTQRRTRTRDFYNAPNRWVFYRSSNTEGQAPVDGDGRYEYINVADGDTSQEGRGGRTITKTLGIDAADQYSLVQAGNQVIAADMLIPVTVALETAPFPLAWHFDKYLISDPALGTAVSILSSSWTLNLDGSDMSHAWSVLP
jgi:hypothetical protein